MSRMPIDYSMLERALERVAAAVEKTEAILRDLQRAEVDLEATLHQARKRAGAKPPEKEPSEQGGKP